MPELQFRSREGDGPHDRHTPSISNARSFQELDGALDADEKITDENRKQFHDQLELFKKGEVPSGQLDQASGLSGKAVDLVLKDWQRQETAQLQRTYTEYRQLLSRYESAMQEAPHNPRMNKQLLQRIMLARDATVERISMLHNEINARFPRSTDRERYFEFPESPQPIPGAGTMTMSGELPTPGGDDPKRKKDASATTGSPEPIIPSKAKERAGWREVGRDEVLPIGSHIEMDMNTGKNYVKETADTGGPSPEDRERYFEFPESSSPIPEAGTMTMSGELPTPGGDDPKRNRLSRLFGIRRKKDAIVPADADSSDGAIPTPDTNAENKVKLSETATSFLMYLDSFPKSSEEISNISPDEVAMLNMYAAALDSMKDDPNFEPVVTQIREKFNSAMEQMGLTSSPQSMSESWTYEELASAKLLYDNSDKKDKEPRTGDPLTDAAVQDQIASKQLGSEMRIANSKIVQESPDKDPVMVFAEHESLQNLDKENPNYSEIMALLQKGYNAENGVSLSETDSTRLGALIRQNLGEENVSIPDLVPNDAEDDTDDTNDESRGRWSWLRRRKKGDDETPKEREDKKPVLGR
ncbi:MAG: hypothetical protein WC693_06500, partial [Patescibacteria group bacterium]